MTAHLVGSLNAAGLNPIVASCMLPAGASLQASLTAQGVPLQWPDEARYRT